MECQTCQGTGEVYNLRTEDCPEKLEPNWKVLYDELADTTHKYRDEWKTKHDDLLADHMDGEEWKARHDDLLHQLQDEERGKDKEWTDDMLVQADKDYDAVTKGVISLINLLRR